MSALEAERPVAEIMAEIGRNARIGARALALATPEQKSRALLVAAGAINAHRQAILAANALDMAAAETKGISKAFLDRLLLKTPVLGGIIRKVAVARFCRTLSTLLASGVPILDGLDITARTSGNAIIEDAILTTRTGIERGETISAPLRETNVFPSMVVQMINVGETTGALDAMLSKIADFYEEEVDSAVAGLLTLLEPIMIAFLGVVVGGIVIAMYLPIFDLISKLTG